VGGAGQQVRLYLSTDGLASLTFSFVPQRDEDLQLVRFKGRPGELSPKARFWLFLGWLLPERFK
jgi:hypothetical protein